MTSLAIPTSTGTIDVEAADAAPGLIVFQAPESLRPESTHRWLLAHSQGRIIAAFESESAATRAAEKVSQVADWTRSVMTVANQISFSLEGGAQAFMQLLRDLGAEES